MNIQNLVLDINKKCNQLVTANVGEVDSRLLKISVIDNGVPMDLTGITVYLYAKKADGTKVFNTVKVEDAKQGIVSAEITSQVLAIEGFVKLTLLLTKDKARLASKIFTLKVDETIVDDEAIESTNEFTALTDALGRVNNIDSRFENVNSQLAHKANLNSIFSMANMGQDVKEAMTGGSVAVVGKNAILNDNIVDGQISANKTNFIIDTRPVVEVDKIVDGYIASDGSVVVSGSWLTTGFIKVFASENYRIVGNNKHFMLYDESKKPILNTYKAADVKNYKFTPSTDGYMRCSFTEVETHPSYQLRNELAVEINNPSITFPVPVRTKLADRIVDSENMAMECIKPEHFSVKLIVSKGEVFKKESGVVMPDGTIFNNTNYMYSDLIEVSPLTNYFVKYAAPILCTFYDKNMSVVGCIATESSTSLEDYKFTTPSDAKYVIINTRVMDLDNQYLYQGDTPLDNPESSQWVDVPWLKTDIMDSVKNEMLSYVDRLINNPSYSLYADKKFVSLGDSITWQDGQAYGQGVQTGKIARGYQTIIKENLGFESYLNKGVSGRPITNGSSNGIGTNTTSKTIDYSNFDLVIIAGGTNDFKLNMPLGELGIIGDTDFNTNTFYGAYRDMVEYILKQKPTIRIVLFTPLQRDNGGYDVNYVNSIGCKLIDYVNAIKDVGKMYGIPICDMYSNSGFTKLTLNTYTMDGLHPNDVGYSRMGNYASKFIDNIGI